MYTHVTLEVCEILLTRLSYLSQDSLEIIHPVSNGIVILNTCIYFENSI